MPVKNNKNNKRKGLIPFTNKIYKLIPIKYSIIPKQESANPNKTTNNNEAKNIVVYIINLQKQL